MRRFFYYLAFLNLFVFGSPVNAGVCHQILRVLDQSLEAQRILQIDASYHDTNPLSGRFHRGILSEALDRYVVIGEVSAVRDTTDVPANAEVFVDVWNLASRDTRPRRFFLTGPSVLERAFIGTPVASMSFDSRFLAVSFGDGRIAIFDLSLEQRFSELQHGSMAISALQFATGSWRLFSGSIDGSVKSQDVLGTPGRSLLVTNPGFSVLHQKQVIAQLATNSSIHADRGLVAPVVLSLSYPYSALHSLNAQVFWHGMGPNESMASNKATGVLHGQVIGRLEVPPATRRIAVSYDARFIAALSAQGDFILYDAKGAPLKTLRIPEGFYCDHFRHLASDTNRARDRYQSWGGGFTGGEGFFQFIGGSRLLYVDAHSETAIWLDLLSEKFHRLDPLGGSP